MPKRKHIEAKRKKKKIPKSAVCIPCGGTGNNSKGGVCFPCDGTGKPRKRNELGF